MKQTNEESCIKPMTHVWVAQHYQITRLEKRELKIKLTTRKINLVRADRKTYSRGNPTVRPTIFGAEGHGLEHDQTSEYFEIYVLNCIGSLL